MNSHTKTLVTVLLAVTVLLWCGCKSMYREADRHINVDVTRLVVDLLAGQHLVAGSVSVWNDATNLYVEYATVENWWLTSAACHVASSWQSIPQTKTGNPIPGKFNYKMLFDPRVQVYTFTIPLTWAVGTTVYIAAHASLDRIVDGEVVQQETGWGKGTQFPGANWGMYIAYTIQNGGGGGLLGEFKTYTQGGWGAVPRGSNPGAYLHANFAGAFPSGLVIGGNYTITLTNAWAVTEYLPDGKTPAPLTQNWVNPTGDISVLAGQVTALTLNVRFDEYDPNFSPSTLNLKDLIVKDVTSPYYGWTVQQVLNEGNRILGGGAGNASQINNAITAINENFDNGDTDNGFLGLP